MSCLPGLRVCSHALWAAGKFRNCQKLACWRQTFRHFPCISHHLLPLIHVSLPSPLREGEGEVERERGEGDVGEGRGGGAFLNGNS